MKFFVATFKKQKSSQIMKELWNIFFFYVHILHYAIFPLFHSLLGHQYLDIYLFSYFRHYFKIRKKLQFDHHMCSCFCLILPRDSCSVFFIPSFIILFSYLSLLVQPTYLDCFWYSITCQKL